MLYQFWLHDLKGIPSTAKFHLSFLEVIHIFKKIPFKPDRGQFVKSHKSFVFVIPSISLKWAATWQNQQSDCVPSKDSDQPGHLPSLIRVFACTQWVANNPSFLHADSEDSDQTGQTPRLIVFAGRTLILLVLLCRGLKSSQRVNNWDSHLIFDLTQFSAVEESLLCDYSMVVYSLLIILSNQNRCRRDKKQWLPSTMSQVSKNHWHFCCLQLL